MHRRRLGNACARGAPGVYEFTGPTRSRSPLAVPRVTVLGGVHGNERIGVLVLDALRQALLGVAPCPRVLAPGATLTLVYANERALRIGRRGSVPHADLNRCFTEAILHRRRPEDAPSDYEAHRARELAPILATTDVLIDLHSTNKPSEPFLRIAGHPRGIPETVARFARRLPCKIWLHDPLYKLAGGRVALTDEYVGANGGVGICFESGLASDLAADKVERLTQSVFELLTEETKSLEPHTLSSDEPSPLEGCEESSMHQREVFEIVEGFELTSTGFRWADGIGEANFQRVPAGEPIGFVGEGPEAVPFAVDYEAFIVFPKIPELWKVDSPLGWLAKKARRC